jgi:hypothetical protein
MDAQQQHMVSIKIRVESPLWSKKLQEIFKSVGITWGYSIEMPWNTDREWLVVQPCYNKPTWYISWATERDFNECPFQEYTAKGLVLAYRKALKQKGKQK